jgi:hypothetical protein
MMLLNQTDANPAVGVLILIMDNLVDWTFIFHRMNGLRRWRQNPVCVHCVGHLTFATNEF